jgi:hypothetical protein
MFGPDIVALYKSVNEPFNPASAIKSKDDTKDDTEALRSLLANDVRFMIGCDYDWNFKEHAASAHNAAPPPPTV